jgi:hypothetical protein
MAFEGKKADFEDDKQNEIRHIKSVNELEKKQVSDKISELKREKSILESGDQNTGEIGLLQINKDIEQNRLEKRTLEQSFVVKKFLTVGTIGMICMLLICWFYLSIFFASALYKVFFEENIIRASLEAGINPGMPQLVDANAVIKIFKQQGTLFGVISIFIFLFPLSLTNLELFGSKSKWVNRLCLWIGLLIFDIVVSWMVALNSDKIESLLHGEVSKMQFWEVVKQGEFYMIFVFGMLPLFVTHHVITYIATAYKKSRREIVDAEKNARILWLEKAMIELNFNKDYLNDKIKEKEEVINRNNDKIQELETTLNNQQNQIESKYIELLKLIKTIYEDFNARITSGRIFIEDILQHVTSDYKSGFIDYLPEYYADNEVTNRVREIEQVIANNN